jgi:hypothetical protein
MKQFTQLAQVTALETGHSTSPLNALGQQLLDRCICWHNNGQGSSLSPGIRGEGLSSSEQP